MTWYSSKRDGRSDRDRRFFSENQECLRDLETYGVTNSTVAYLLSVKEVLVWKWATGQVAIPGKFRKKLEKLIQMLKCSN